MASGAAAQKSSTSILTNHIMILCTTALIYILLSTDLTRNADGGIIGSPDHTNIFGEIISQTTPELSTMSLQDIKNNLLSFCRCLTCVTVAATQL